MSHPLERAAAALRRARDQLRRFEDAQGLSWSYSNEADEEARAADNAAASVVDAGEPRRTGEAASEPGHQPVQRPLDSPASAPDMRYIVGLAEKVRNGATGEVSAMQDVWRRAAGPLRCPVCDHVAHGAECGRVVLPMTMGASDNCACDEALKPPCDHGGGEHVVEGVSGGGVCTRCNEEL